ncbi:tetratricopeptide repeat protein [Micromonosporaceae bacterium Da 78-11]
MKTADELWGLLEQARTMPYGAAQIALVEQVMRHVDATGDPGLAFTTRLIATNAYVYGGEQGKAFVTFSWCVSDFDRNPGPHHQNRAHTLLWQFKTMINALTNFPEIPLARTYAVLDDMERRYREGGHSMQAVYKHRYLVADHVGLATEADKWYERWQATPRDSLSDCAGCDPSSVAGYLSSRERYADVVTLAEPVLSGDLSCTEQPQGILRQLTVPYLEVGRLEDAADAHRRSYRLERGNLADLWNIGTHISFCARTGNEQRGLEMLQRHLDWLDKAPSPAAAMHFASSAALLLRRLTELGHGAVPVHRRDRDDITVADLRAELTEFATGLARRFDERNGTTHQSGLIAKELAAEPYGSQVPLSPTSRRDLPPVVVAVPPPAPAPEIPADLGAAELLDLAEEHAYDDRDDLLDVTLTAFDQRFADVDELGPLLAGRRASLYRRDDWRSDPEKLVKIWLRAIDQLTEGGAPAEAAAVRGRLGLSYCLTGRPDDGLPLIEDEVAHQDEHGTPRQRASAWGRLALARFTTDDFEAAAEAMDRADEQAAVADRPRQQAFQAVWRSRIEEGRHRHHEALTSARAAQAFFRAHGPADRLAEAAMLVGNQTEDPAEALQAYSEVLAGGVRDAEAAARAGRGRALMRLDRAAEAIPELVELVALCAEHEMVEGAAFARQDLANAYRLAGRPVEAAEVGEEALLRFEQLGFDGPADDTRLLLAGLYREVGDNPAALVVYQDLIGRLTDNLTGRAQIGEQLGGLLFDLDRDAEAAAAFEAAAADLRASDDPVGELRALRRRLSALHYADDVDAAEQLIVLAEERYRELPPEAAAEPNAVWQWSMTAFEAARVRMSRGRYAEAIPLLAGVPERLRAIGAVDDADHLEGMHGEALMRSGSPAEAEALLRGLLERMPADASGRELATRLHQEASDLLNGR